MDFTSMLLFSDKGHNKCIQYQDKVHFTKPKLKVPLFQVPEFFGQISPFRPFNRVCKQFETFVHQGVWAISEIQFKYQKLEFYDQLNGSMELVFQKSQKQNIQRPGTQAIFGNFHQIFTLDNIFKYLHFQLILVD